MEKLRMWFIKNLGHAGWSYNGGSRCDEAHIAKRCETAKRRAEVKKGTSRETRLPTKTYGNCLLGLHSSQKACRKPAPALNSRSLQVANSKKLSTAYPQAHVGNLWMSAGCGEGPTNQPDFGTKWPKTAEFWRLAPPIPAAMPSEQAPTGAKPGLGRPAGTGFGFRNPVCPTSQRWIAPNEGPWITGWV